MVAQIMRNGLNLKHCKKLKVEGGGRIHSKAFGKRRSLGFIFENRRVEVLVRVLLLFHS